jgi:hypothetical protein
MLFLLTSSLCMLGETSDRVPFLAVRRTQHEPMLSSGKHIPLCYEAPPSSCSQSEVCWVQNSLLPVTHDGIHKPWCSHSVKINVLSLPRDTTFSLRTALHALSKPATMLVLTQVLEGPTLPHRESLGDIKCVPQESKTCDHGEDHLSTVQLTWYNSPNPLGWELICDQLN